MIDRFIQQQKRAALCDKQSQLQAGALSERQRRCRTQRVIPFEEKIVQEVARFGFIERRYGLDSLQRVGSRIQQLLLLGHIPELDVPSRPQAASQWTKFPGDGADESGLTGSIGTCQHDALS